MNKDQLLIERLSSGSHEALKELMMTYQHYVYSILNSMLYEHEAVEACQDTFLKAFRHIKKFEGNSKLSTWLYRIAYCTGLDYLKKRKRTVDIQEVTADSTMTQGEAVTDLLNQQDLSGALSRLMTQLRSDEAGILRMYYFDEMTIKEISAITSLSEANLKVKLYRARKKLKEQIELHKAQHLREYIY